MDEGILREWLVNMGRKAADRQIAHMFCELLCRLEAVGMANDDAFELPLTQIELADAVGLSSVHVNRVIQHLRDQDLIRWRGVDFEVPNYKPYSMGGNRWLQHSRRRTCNSSYLTLIT